MVEYWFDLTHQILMGNLMPNSDSFAYTYSIPYNCVQIIYIKIYLKL